MNWLTNLLRDSDEKHALIDDLAAFACYVAFAALLVAFLWGEA
jgi:phosphate starvation-inducible membrane PsiE